MLAAPVIVCFRQDLRVADNPALHAAMRRGGPILPLFIWAPDEEGEWPPGAAARWWLHHSLARLNADLMALGSRLIIRRGPTLPTLLSLARETGTRSILWSRRHEPAATARDAAIKSALLKDGIESESFNAALLFEPGTVANQSGKPFQVFTPFWRHCLARSDQPAAPLPVPRFLTPPSTWPDSLSHDDLQLEPSFPWAARFDSIWKPGSGGATLRLRRFLDGPDVNYAADRNRPDQAGTSGLSPHLHFGEISPRQIWHAARRRAEKMGLSESDWKRGAFLTEVGWREFAHHLLFHFPHTPTEPLRSDFKKFLWRPNATWLKAWQRGQTGFPLVDAGMRELWTTGWMHNRVRMVTASFLVKHLLIDWREGARWFWDTLVDADLANNTLGWQWTAGCGADASPFFRIFNPVTQGTKFDPNGDYVRRWVPELAHLPSKWIHHPWDASGDVLTAAGVVLGKNYPEPIVQHSIAREVALEAYRQRS